MDVLLTGAEIRTEADLHAALDRALDFGPYYGRNLSALWDVLMYNVERPVHILWRDHETSRAALGADRFAKVVRVFDIVQTSDAGRPEGERFTYELR